MRGAASAAPRFFLLSGTGVLAFKDRVMPINPRSALAGLWNVLFETVRVFGRIGGEQRAAAFAYYALFSMVPLVALMLSFGSFFFEPEDIHQAIAEFAPVGPAQREIIFNSVENLQRARGGISVISILILMWTSLRFFQALVRAVNAAWDTEELPWWQIPLKNLAMVAVIGSALVLGILIPAIIQGLRKAVTALDSFLAAHLPGIDLAAIFQALDLSRYLVSAIVLFYAFAMLYKLAPRRKVHFSEVWLPALVVTLLLQIVQVGFVNILPRFINYSSIYGSIGGLMLLLFWIYITGQIIILGGCLSATIARACGDLPEKTSPR